MEDVIRRIISIEEKAQEMMLDARKAESGLDKRVEAEDKRLDREIRSKADERCRLIKESEHDGISDKIDSINAETTAQIARLEEKYRENKEKWVDDIVLHIIGE